MTPERWQRIKEIFDAALELAPEKRSIFIQEICGGDDDLSAEVMRIMDQVGRSTPLFDEPFWRSDTPAGLTFRDAQLISNRYRVIRFIGRGGMGEVYEAEDTQLGERVALKIIRPDVASDRKIISRFRQEIKLSRKVTHPNVCRVFDVEWHREPHTADEQDTEVTFLTMELLAGETLSQRLKRGRMACPEARGIVRQMAAALNAAHEAGVIHRDFKPSNVILVSLPDGGIRTVVTDFGLARGLTGETRDITLTEPMQMMGTPDYMAPEQVEGGVITPAADVYALGLVIYEMVTGTQPFKSDSAFQSAVKRLRHAPKSPRALVPDIDSRCETAILRCLQMDPAKRGKVLDAVSEWTESRRRFWWIPARVNWPAVRGARRRVWLGIALSTAAMALSISALRFYSRRPAIAAGSKVLLTNVENLTGDRDLDGITVALRSQLNQSAFFNLLDDSRVRAGLQRMVLPRNHALDPETARQLANREGVPLVIYGSISKLAQDYELSLKMEQISSGSLMPGPQWRGFWSAGTKRELFEAIHEGSEWVRKQAGEAREDMVSEDRRPEETTTDSWEALKLFSLAEDRKAHDHTAEAIDLLHEATERDPQFALAWMRLGDLAFSLNRSREGYTCWKRALAVKDSRRLTSREQYRIQGSYALDAGDFAAALSAFRLYAAHYPGDYLARFYQARPLMMLGKIDQALNALEEARALQPDAYYTVSHLGMYRILRGSLLPVPKLAAWLRERGQEQSALAIEGSLAFLQHDFPRAENRLSSITRMNRPEWQSRGYQLEACLFAEQGRVGDARGALANGIEFDARKGDASGRADKLLSLAYLDLRARDLTSVKLRVKDAMSGSLSAAQLMRAGTLLARANLLEDANLSAQRLDDTLEGPFREIAKRRIQGEILLARGRKSDALAEFQKADAMEPPFTPRDYLARAWEAGGNREEAREIYRKMAASPQSIWYQPDTQFPGVYADALSDYVRLLSEMRRPELSSERARLQTLRTSTTERNTP